MLFTVLKIVIAPVCIGVVINHLAGKSQESKINSRPKKILTSLKPLFPLISVIAIVLIIAIIVAVNHTRLADLSLVIITAVIHS